MGKLMKSLTIKTILAISTLGSFSTMHAAPAVSLGDEVHLFVNLASGFEYNSNITRKSKGAELEDTIFTIHPGIEVTLGEGSASAVFTASYEFREYLDYGDDFSGEYGHLKLVTVYDNGVTSFQGLARYDQYSSAANTSDNLNPFIAANKNFEKSVISGTVKHGLNDSVDVSVGGIYDKTEYDRDSLGIRLVGSEGFSVPVKLYYKVTPEIATIAGYRYREVQTDGGSGNPPIAYQDDYYFVGLDGVVFNELWSVDLDAGYQERSSSAGSSDGLSFNGKLNYSADSNKSMYVMFSRDFKSGTTAGNSYVETLFYAGGSLKVSERLSATARAGVGQSKYSTITRKEDLILLSTGLNYIPNEYLTIGARIQYTDIDGKGTGAANYNATSISLNASLRY